MKVSNLNQTAQQLSAYVNSTQGTQSAHRQNGQTQTDKKQSGVNNKDMVNISTSSRMLQRAGRLKAASAPERTEKVQAVGEQVQSNNYKVNSTNVAGAMMKDLIKNLG
ncbi:MAG: flagellar biosynthesis anti-sigma factor FlgM [Desulfobacteraceae bacterium]|nr:flagellar biosynthesis anti-sigma factor FlgM [Desulfobacteraceae bacterium]